MFGWMAILETKKGLNMSLEKIVSVDKIEIVENGSIQVRTKTTITEDGKTISSQFHRHVIHPGQSYENEDVRVRSICQLIHTPQVIADYQQQMQVSKQNVRA